jgi:hypothetical protein
MERRLLQLSELPTDIYRILFEYLTLKELVTFENANTSSDTRSLFLSALDGMTLSILDERPLTKRAMQWILLRNISMKVIVFYDFGHEGVELVSKYRSTIQSVSCSDHVTLDQFDLGHCPSLKSLSLQASYGHSELKGNIDRLLSPNPQLRILDLSDPACMRKKPFPVRTIDSITEYCPNLTHLFLKNISWVRDKSIPDLIAGCPNLMALDLRGTNVTQSQTIRLLIDSLPRLCYLAHSSLGQVMSELNLRKIALPAIFSEDVEAQELGVRGLDDLFIYETDGQSSPEDPPPPPLPSHHHHVLDRILAR